MVTKQDSDDQTFLKGWACGVFTLFFAFSIALLFNDCSSHRMQKALTQACGECNKNGDTCGEKFCFRGEWQ